MEDRLSESPDSRRKATQNVGVEGVDELDGRGKPIPTEPIAIKGELGRPNEHKHYQ